MNLMKPYYAASVTGIAVPSDDTLGGAVKPVGLVGSGEASSVEPMLDVAQEGVAPLDDSILRGWLKNLEFQRTRRFGSWVVLLTTAQTC